MIIQAEFGTCEYIRVPDFDSIKFQIYPMFILTVLFFTTAINLREAGRKVKYLWGIPSQKCFQILF